SQTWTAMDNTGFASRDIVDLAVDAMQSQHSLYAATLSRGMHDFKIVPASAPALNIQSPAPPYPVQLKTSPIQVSVNVFNSPTKTAWFTNRGHAGQATLTTGITWTASVPLETGRNVITLTGVDALSNEGSTSLSVFVAVPPGDFNVDGKADLLSQNSAGFNVWFTNGSSMTGSAPLSAVPSDGTMEGVGDFNGDGSPDILWRHASGAVEIRLMSGTSLIGSASLGVVTPDWKVEA